MGICCTTPELRIRPPNRKPLVRMCSSGNHFSNFADIGDKVVLFVDFGEHFKPSPHRHSLHAATAGRVWPDQREHDPDKEQYEVSTNIFSKGEGYLPKYWSVMVFYFKSSSSSASASHHHHIIIRPKYVILPSHNLIPYFTPDCIWNNGFNNYKNIVFF